MRKRLLSLALALVLSLGLTAPAAAATVTELAPSRYFQSFHEFSEGLAAVFDRDSGWGYMDATGKMVIPCQYLGLDSLWPESFMDFSEGVTFVAARDEKNWLKKCVLGLDKSGNTLFTLPEGYVLEGRFREGLAAVANGYKCGYIDKTGKEVIPCQYSDVQSFSEGLAAVYNAADAYWGYIDKSGSTVLPFQYQTAESFGARYPGCALVKLMDGRKTLIDKTGRDVIPAGYTYYIDIDKDSAWERSGRYVPLQSSDNKTDSVYDLTTGQIVKRPFYAHKDYFHFHEGFAQVMESSSYISGRRFVNENCEVITSQIYDSLTDFSGGYALGSRDIMDGEVIVGSALFVIDSAGNEIRRLDHSKYISYRYYAEGLLAVCTDGNYRWGFIDTTGKEVVPCKYKSVSQFHNGVAPVQNFTGYWGLVDTSGNEIVPCRYIDAKYLGGDGLWALRVSAAAPNAVMIRVSGAAPYSSAPSTPSTPAQPAGPSANPTNSKVLVNGKEVAFDAYTIDGSNYFKLRDLAFVLNGTEKQFEVGWDNASKTITLTSGSAYTANGSEMAKGSGAQSASVSASKLLIDGKEVSLTAYTIGGNNYFKLRDIGQAFDFGIGWDNVTKTITIDTGAGYTA